MNSDDVDPQATQFAITNLNVPDRLDLQDIEDHKRADEGRRLRLDSIARWTMRLVLGLVVVAIAVGGIEAYGIWRNSISPASIGERLTSSLGVPVSVGDSEVALSPAPRLVVRRIAFGDKATIDELSIGLGIQGLSEIIRGKGVHWGEAVVHSAHFTPEQGNALLQLLPGLAGALPRGVTALKVERLEIDGQSWLKGAASISTVREADGSFTSAVLQQQLNKGSLRLQLSPAAAPGDAAPSRSADSGDALPASARLPATRFQLEAKNWVLPFGSKLPLEDVVASGQIDASRLEVGEYSIGGPFGLVQGSVRASRVAKGWVMDGTSKTGSFDLEALIRLVAPVPEDDKESRPPALVQGTAAFSGSLEGKGESLEEAFAKASFSAPVTVRWAVLNGVDLGYVATHPGSRGGTGGNTRFTTLDASILASGDQVRIGDIHGKAGALSTSGAVVVDPSLGLNGTLRVDLGVVRIQAPIRVEVRGTILKPVYGR